MEGNEIGKPCVKAILVKVFVKYFTDINELDFNNQDELEELSDGGTSRRLLKSERSGKSGKSRKTAVPLTAEQIEKNKEEDLRKAILK